MNRNEASRPRLEKLKSDFLDSSGGFGITSQSYIPPPLGNSGESDSKNRSNSAPASTETYALTSKEEALISAIQKNSIKSIDSTIGFSTLF